ncbi:hypothetical protein JHN55_06955 [Streptomyces sp. MBT56]|uniref:hypothetical protein n=1 Tax=unclassified Streptomyces TaxID=2593676 RepID=UPI00190E1E8D|nr:MULTISPECIES: hypothetical protein [unclassified Streptomyces]MBK3556277.1 hypothetical protein [Streptomyces sp. MBT56]MBK3601257.1 hypothetical protein [Streptomyces sp. MBT54]MBK3620118.1 hypothetical protein [Streptomyces sp. MBT98]MBK6047707.1 hypothetical protein [Streptomyces sp. MBT55]
MTDRTPIIPTRIIPGGAPLPAGPPPPGAVPPWRAPAPAAAAPPPPPPPAPPAVAVPPPPPPEPVHVHHVHVTVQPVPYYEPIEPTRWERLWAWIRTIGRPWQLIVALLAAVIPFPFTGHSAASTWAYTVNLARTEWGVPYGYALAGLALAWVVLRIVRHGGTLLRIWAGVVTVIGLISAIDLFDVVTLLTGVTR